MMQGSTPVAKMLPDGRRLHLHHGPIDLIVEALGANWEDALKQAQNRFHTLLNELVGELEELRQPCKAGHRFQGKVAQRMQIAVEYFTPQFITPMAAVAGAVADEILDSMKPHDEFDKIHVNNGGDIAFYLGGGQKLIAAIAAPSSPRIIVHSQDKFRGIATSGWRGRSQSLGIADSVSVVAANCAGADAAATMIANGVNLTNHSSISRLPANEIFPDSDLGKRLVTVEVGDLRDDEISRAFDHGEKIAQACLKDGMIAGAIMVLQNQTRQVGANHLIHHDVGEITYGRV